MDMDMFIKTLKREFNYDFSFKSLRPISDPRDDSFFRVKTRYYFGPNALRKRTVREHDNPALEKIGVTAIEYKDAFFRSVLALKLDVPTFDSGDREFDSRHTLYLFHSMTDVSALYCKEGYSISELYILETLSGVSEELYTKLKELNFPMRRIKSL